MEKRELVGRLFINIGLLFSFLSFGQTNARIDTVLGINNSNPIQLDAYIFKDFRNLDSSLREIYPFIDFGKNNYSFYTESSKNFEILYEKFKKITETKKGKLNLYHIGGSHLQADIYTHDMRTHLQQDWAKIPGERGWVFPFDLAHTNNPGNYEFSSPNKWTAYRSVVQKSAKYDIDYGLLGALITCDDSVINIYFKHDRTNVKPPFNRVRIFHNIGELPYWLHFGEEEILVWKKITNEAVGYTDVFFTDPIETMDLQFSKEIKNAPELEIYGFIFMNDDSGISYTSIGINGAGLYTYLDNIRFEEQLKTYPPDFFAFSVGTNDGNVPYADFNPQVYKNNLEKLMQIVLRANPDCALLLTVPNDAYYYKRYPNKNIAREREVIVELAQKYNMAVWDLYGVMGELGSSRTWQQNKLMGNDFVHFTTAGYHLKGELYYDAFLKFLDQMEERSKLVQQ